MSTKNIKFLISLFILLAISACARVPSSLNRESLVKYKSYKVGEAKVSSIGDSMISIVSGFMRPHYRTTSDAIANGTKRLSPGQDWVAMYKYRGDGEGDYIIVSKGYFRNRVGIIIKENGSVVEKPVCRIGRKHGGKRWGFHGSEKKVIFNRYYPVDKSSKGFKCELIYNGKIGSSISLKYREYNSNLAREAFYQDLQYDLSESDIIRFKTINMKILSATNSNIKFMVTEDQQLPWLSY